MDAVYTSPIRPLLRVRQIFVENKLLVKGWKASAFFYVQARVVAAAAAAAAATTAPATATAAATAATASSTAQATAATGTTSSMFAVWMMMLVVTTMAPLITSTAAMLLMRCRNRLRFGSAGRGGFSSSGGIGGEKKILLAGGACSFVACLSHWTIDHAILSRKTTLPIPGGCTSNIQALGTFPRTLNSVLTKFGYHMC